MPEERIIRRAKLFATDQHGGLNFTESEDTAALVETAIEMLNLLGPPLPGTKLEAAHDAVRALAQRLADMTENEAHAVQAFKAAEARAERAEAALREARQELRAEGTPLAAIARADKALRTALAAKRCPTCGAPGFCFDHMKGTPTEEPEHG